MVGAGVVGLTCADRLLEAGHRVDVLARDLPRETTSAAAAALWYPYLAQAHDQPLDRVAGWCETSYAAFAALADDSPRSGVRMLRGVEVAASDRPDPWWAAVVPRLDRVPDGWSFVAPVVSMPTYLDWLAARVLELGGTLTRLSLRSLPEGGDLVVNCSGLGARLLGADRSVTPVRGQVVHVEQFGLDTWWLDGSAGDAGGPTYVVPREDSVVIGGTEEVGDWSRTPSPETAAAILRRAVRLVPEVAYARVLRHQVGLRPVRPEVRLEREGRVVHCYGHGGAGVTLSWGCADEVVGLVS